MKAIYLFFVMIITAILGIFSPQDTDEVENLSTPNTYYGTEIIIDETEMQEEQEIIYYDTLEESLYEFGKNDDLPVTNILQIVKIIKNDNLWEVFYLVHEKEQDLLYTSKMQIKTEDKDIKYSQPLLTTADGWAVQKWYFETLEKYYDDTEVFSEKIKIDLSLFNSTGFYNLDENGYWVRWGINNREETKTMKINGKEPTEIIELTMNGEPVYFWYYENLPISKSEIKTTQITY
jgi:hypothetical protein